MKIRTVFAFLSAPIIGEFAGALSISLVVPGNAVIFNLIYAIVGSAIALVGSIVIGGRNVYFVRRASQPLLSWLLLIAFHNNQQLRSRNSFTSRGTILYSRSP